MLPNFFCVGAQKSATTSLHYYLSNHPDIYLPKQKETKFFVDESEFNKGINYYIAEYFSSWGTEKVVGEIDPDYMYFPEALKRINDNLDTKNIKIIFVLRNPIDRAFSHYLMTYRRGYESLSFDEAVRQEESRIKKSYFSNFHQSYVARGFYLKQIEKILEYIDSENMLFLLMEDIQNEPLKSVKTVFQFLEIDDQYIPENIGNQFHAGKVPVNLTYIDIIKRPSAIKGLFKILFPFPKLRRLIKDSLLSLNEKEIPRDMVINDSVRKYLLDLYIAENKRLSKVIDRDLSHWT